MPQQAARLGPFFFDQQQEVDRAGGGSADVEVQQDVAGGRKTARELWTRRHTLRACFIVLPVIVAVLSVVVIIARLNRGFLRESLLLTMAVLAAPPGVISVVVYVSHIAARSCYHLEGFVVSICCFGFT